MIPKMRWGEICYWAGTIIASLLVLWVLWGYAFNADRGEPIIQIIPLVLAGAIWLAGWTCRRILTGRY
jgi:hypothetical protein